MLQNKNYQLQPKTPTSKTNATKQELPTTTTTPITKTNATKQELPTTTTKTATN